MTRFPDRYSKAIRSKNLRSKAEAECDADVIGAAGFGGLKGFREDGTQRTGSPLAMALLRLMLGDARSAKDIVRILAEGVTTKAWRLYGLALVSVEANDMAAAVLAWHRDGVCHTCGGHGYQVAGGYELGEGRAVIGDVPCERCHGTGKLPFDAQFAMDRLELARWLRAEVEKEQAIAGAEAMKALAPRLDF